METKKLEMIFVNEGNRNFTISVDDPKLSLDKDQVHEGMNKIIDANIFNSGEFDLVGINKARFITRIVEDLE